MYLHIVNNLFGFATRSRVNVLFNAERPETGVFVKVSKETEEKPKLGPALRAAAAVWSRGLLHVATDRDRWDESVKVNRPLPGCFFF